MVAMVSLCEVGPSPAGNTGKLHESQVALCLCAEPNACCPNAVTTCSNSFVRFVCDILPLLSHVEIQQMFFVFV